MLPLPLLLAAAVPVAVTEGVPLSLLVADGDMLDELLSVRDGLAVPESDGVADEDHERLAVCEADCVELALTEAVSDCDAVALGVALDDCD